MMPFVRIAIKLGFVQRAICLLKALIYCVNAAALFCFVFFGPNTQMIPRQQSGGRKKRKKMCEGAAEYMHIILHT